MTQALFWEISLWVARIIIPACDSGFDLEAKDASENATNRRSSGVIGLILMVTSWCFLAMCKALLAEINVDTVALLIWDCKWLKELFRSGLVCTAAYWSDPIKPRSKCRSASVTGALSWARRSGFREMGLMFFTDFDWDNSMLRSVFWWRSIPVKVKLRVFLIQMVFGL